ncbi:branched-chain alpha-keto acid dehydrogenase subunit E2 [Phenylobacterium sp. Root77]|uniref:pyruvate dehydrogenase complex dihydrolipoamide acetyltransferase n=1 Tax=unclassified Phenylobacterium TaxID=2640670 RepID=UPI0006FF67E5|nr:MULTISPECIES: pyruvate dehydrogenase complex dihydrolipoamide acetyltransferase [unclassified Phenylobacterium]KQW71578.1 branched-chain alpha-keto acid dehydrogenase subunit E2 [Phenylobacterium sp. Root1277]KQW94498.1 branched-chain alpha-keto acid dehydrogenase subunit E2 [Phenylobacterium sp. Root1290]KRC44192.1 branched-chain alpha-keto acid dehydrogenase subunit E2 [Phenylobacterium sp. Root77]
MSIDVLMPALSPTMEEGTLAKWHVKKGDKVSSGDVIAEIETDKATMEVEAVDEGVVEDILVPEGSEGVKVNTPIARLAGEDGASAAPAAKAEPVKAEAAPKAEAAKAAPPKAEAAPSAKPTAQTPAAPARHSGERIFASPLARRIAGQKGLDLAQMQGSGPHGRIIKRDVEGATPQAAKPAAAGATSAAPRQAQTLAQMGIPDGSYDLIPLDGMRKTVARRMTDSFRDVPHFPLTIDLEIDGLLASRAKINAMLEKQGVKVSVNDLVIKAAAVALKQVPEANASYSPEGIAMHHNADIAMAVAIEGGLITPIIRKAETKGLAQIAVEAKDLAERARTRKLKPDEFQGGTFSVSNLGMFGIKSFGSIINEPQGCILSVGAGEPRPVVKNGQLAIATVMTVTLSCDHRVVDGATGARWLQAFKALIEDPITMIV